ncbi:mandelate racemase/muconate lactonizing enzyme family protein [Arachidicoccus terrestris]|uniref:mandelate racemase/muconate lactonizing enzyme family protein n=1 Tax=Arachidicoccus terrestris TaxID=2875539 RepID=UPI001CC4AFD8|nr:dipeptide epimerase [Arachidicoccus terrestris]UAY56681.1 dipeptide epimerase [Arachidicoccus terrestris]
MKIKHTEIYQFSIPMVPFAIATGTMDYAQNVLIRLHTDEGIIGTGECSAFPMIVGETQQTCIAVAKDFATLIKGKNPLNIEVRLAEFDSYIAGNTTVKSAFDMALYDIAAQDAVLPLYAYLGGDKKEIITDITVGIDTPEQMAALAFKFKENGASTIKVKVGKEPRTDILRIKAIRAAVGPDLKIRLDANQGWRLEEAIEALAGMRDLDIEFCEQPMRSYDDDKIAALKSQIKIPLMADESCYHPRDVAKNVLAGFDYINIKLAKAGGIFNALRLDRNAADVGVPCMMGGMLESRMALTAMAHLVLAAGNIRFIDMDTCLLGHTEDPVTRGVEINQYRLRLPSPDLPGIGAEIDPSFLSKCARWCI